ncbi:TonB-dependent siderophore receptor [Sphingomonas citri]
MAQLALLAAAAALAGAVPPPAPEPAHQQQQASDEDIEVRGERLPAASLTRSTLRLVDVPQSVTVVSAETFLRQGALSIADAVRYAAGAASSTARDTRFDWVRVRGVEPSLLRDGMRDQYGVFASIAPDPYGFAQVELLRGPASMLFGRGAIGGVINLATKTPQLQDRAALQAIAGSYGRAEWLVDAETVAGTTLGARLMLHARDAGTYVPHVPDDRLLVAPSLAWHPGGGTEITLLASFQRDHTGSIANFLPVIGTIRDNHGRAPLPGFLFLGVPGGDRYDGSARQVGAIATQRLGGAGRLTIRARYTSGDVEYRTHYPNSYPRPTDPYLPDGTWRHIPLLSYGAHGGLHVLAGDASLGWRLVTGPLTHQLLAGADYGWHDAYRRFGLGSQLVDLYALDRAAIVPAARKRPLLQSEEDRQLGLYAQDELRLWERATLVLGARHDRVDTDHAAVQRGPGSTAMSGPRVDRATTLRVGASADIGGGVTPYLSYNESFEPIAGLTAAGTPFVPKTGHQHEAGIKWQPDAATLVTLAAFRIAEQHRPVPDPDHPTERIQAGTMLIRGSELEARRTLPGDYEVSVAYATDHLSGEGAAFDAAPRHLASLWLTRALTAGAGTWRVGGGLRYVGEQVSRNATWTLVTPAGTLVDAVTEYRLDRWHVAVNATNLLDRRGYSSCLARGDCFAAAPRDVRVSLGVDL